MDTIDNKSNNFQEDTNMNRALTKLFVSLFAPKHNQAYYNLLVQDTVQ